MSNDLNEKIKEIKRLLIEIQKKHNSSVFSSSYGAEDMVLMDLIYKHASSIMIFTIDTGRLPDQTYRLMQDARDFYGKSVDFYFPKNENVEIFVR